jgi:type IV secretory pathway TraG/TraD family ATPase VirD4
MIPAIARSNKVATIYMAQDFSQMVFSYGKEAAEVIISNLNNQFYGRVGSLATAKHVSELFGKEKKRKREQVAFLPEGIAMKKEQAAMNLF